MQKPSECLGCSLYTKGSGFAHAVGPVDADICLVGGALNRTEASQGRLGVGESSVYLNRALSRLGLSRSQIRIGNVISCQPHNDWITGAPWEFSATQHCSVHRRNLGQHKVYVTMGVHATKTMLKEICNVEYNGKLNDWHGYVVGDGPYVVPTFDPAFILRGNHKLFGAFLYDVRRAMEVASFGVRRDPVDLVVDPDPQWFTEYVEHAVADPEAWMAVDIECPIKGNDEDDSPIYVLTDIMRINFSVNPLQGITVPWEDRYLFGIRRLLDSPLAKVFWNERFDVPILTSKGFAPQGVILDGMWAWHMLQSSLPKGLGFVTPFYSTMQPWKHLSLAEPGKYAAQDAVAQLQCMMGIAKHLRAQGQWQSFIKYAVNLDATVLHPAEKQGILLNTTDLRLLQEELRVDREQVESEIAALVPEPVLPWAGGWKRQPSTEKYPNAVLRKVKETVLCCTDCGVNEVGPAHKCKKEPR